MKARYEVLRNGTLVGRFQTYHVARQKWLSFLFKPWTKCDRVIVKDLTTGVVLMDKSAA